MSQVLSVSMLVFVIRIFKSVFESWRANVVLYMFPYCVWNSVRVLLRVVGHG
jgi:hypothetical protein